MKRALIAFGFWLVLAAFTVVWALCTVIYAVAVALCTVIELCRFPRRRDLADTFDPVRPLRR